jgi:hypothetical protein
MHQYCHLNAVWVPPGRQSASGKEPSVKSSCSNAPVQNVQPITTETLAVAGVEVVDKIPDRARCITRPFYADEVELLRSMLRELRGRFSVTVAPSVQPDAVAIYRTYER